MCLSIMSDFFVMPQYASLRGKLVLKTVIYYSKLLGFQNFACLKLEHYESDTEFIDRLYLGKMSINDFGNCGISFNTFLEFSSSIFKLSINSLISLNLMSSLNLAVKYTLIGVL